MKARLWAMLWVSLFLFLVFLVVTALNAQRQRVRQSKTTDIIRKCAEIAINDHYEIPQKSLSELSEALSKSCDMDDAWGNPLKLLEWNDPKGMHFRIASSGEDGSFVYSDLRDYESGYIPEGDYNGDIVFEDNRFVLFAPRGH